MNLTLIFFGALVLISMIYILFRKWVGFTMGKCIAIFQIQYDILIAEYPKPIALKMAFEIFKKAPYLRKLTSMQIEDAIKIILITPEPKSVIIQLLFSLHAKEAYKLFKNQEELLKKVIPYLKSNNSNSLNQC